MALVTNRRKRYGKGKSGELKINLPVMIFVPLLILHPFTKCPSLWKKNSSLGTRSRPTKSVYGDFFISPLM